MKTSIATIATNAIAIGPASIVSIISNHTIASMVLTLNGREYDDRHEEMVNAMAVGFCDHGLSPPSTIAARLAATCDVDLSKSLIAALACMGDTHAPITKAMAVLADWEYNVELPKHVPGFGHPIHVTDPRVAPLMAMAAAFFGQAHLTHCAKARTIEALIPVRLNYAGAVAAICLDLGIQPAFAMLIAILGRFLGLTAHFIEQQKEPQRVICYDQDRQAFVE